MGVQNGQDRQAAAPLVADGPHLLFLGDIRDRLTAKTAFGLAEWRSDRVTGQWRLTADTVNVGVPDLSPAQARLAGARSLLIGAAPAGGQIPPHWGQCLTEAAEAGLDIVSGLHSRLADVPGLSAAAARRGVRLVEIRIPPSGIPVGTAMPSDLRILTPPFNIVGAFALTFGAVTLRLCLFQLGNKLGLFHHQRRHRLATQQPAQRQPCDQGGQT